MRTCPASRRTGSTDSEANLKASNTSNVLTSLKALPHTATKETNTTQPAGKKAIEIGPKEGNSPTEINTNIHNHSNVVIVNRPPLQNHTLETGRRLDRF